MIHCLSVQTFRVKSQFRHALHEKTCLQCELCESLVIKYVSTVEFSAVNRMSYWGNSTPGHLVKYVAKVFKYLANDR